MRTHNKGKDGYVEKLEFLERADLRFRVNEINFLITFLLFRQFEQEKALREKTRKSLMK